MYISERVLFRGLTEEKASKDHSVNRYLVASIASAGLVAGLIAISLI